LILGKDILYKKSCWVFFPCVEGFPKINYCFILQYMLSTEEGTSRKNGALWLVFIFCLDGALVGPNTLALWLGFDVAALVGYLLWR
jgi:hypothetical protein